MADKKITDLDVSQTISQSDKVIANVGGSAKQVVCIDAFGTSDWFREHIHNRYYWMLSKANLFRSMGEYYKRNDTDTLRRYYIQRGSVF